MSPRPFLRFLVILTSAAAAQAQPERQWSQGDPSADAQYAMEWLNTARRDPPGTLNGLFALKSSDPLITAFLSAEDPATAAQLESNLQSAWATAEANSVRFPNSEAISTAPLAFYPLFLDEAKRRGSQSGPPAPVVPPQRPLPTYLYPTPIDDTILSGPSATLSGSNATGGTASFGPYGATYSEVEQANLYAPGITGREYVLSILCNPGSGSPLPLFLRQGDTLPDLTLGHTRLAGIDVSNAQAGARTLTLFEGSSEFFTQSDLPFGNTGTVFITGVAYRDSNSNQSYDPGEGLAGVQISPDRGDWFAVTASAGGYALPVPAHSGTYLLTATGGPFHSLSASVTVGSDNVKVDWTLPADTEVLPQQILVPPAASQGQLIGLSTRGLAQTSDAAMMGGFVILGPAQARKKLLIRGVGPSLETVGFPGSECLPATQITLYAEGTPLAANSGWTTAVDGGASEIEAAAEAGDFPLVPWAGGGGDSALVETLPPGAYTVTLAPAPGAPAAVASGRVGLFELYDLTPSDGSRLVNVSTRGLVGSGDSQMTVGCTVANGSERLLIRGSGPALGSLFGVPGPLANPTLKLFDSSGAQLAFDDDWSASAQTNQIRDIGVGVGAFALPEAGLDSALIALVPSGSYTAVAGPKAGTQESGVALVELYEAP